MTYRYSAQLVEACEVLSEYVTYGAMKEANQFDDRFEAVCALAPYADSSESVKLWRAIVLSPAQYSSLSEQGFLDLEPRNFASWTKVRESASRILRERSLRMPESYHGVLVERDTSTQAIVADVSAMYRAAHWTGPDFPEWGNYIDWENEVLVRNTHDANQIQLRDVVHHNTARLFSEVQDPLATVMRPFAGETYWSDKHDDVRTIRAITPEQPHLERGFWVVENDDGETAALHLDRHGWTQSDEELDPPSPRRHQISP